MLLAMDLAQGTPVPSEEVDDGMDGRTGLAQEINFWRRPASAPPPGLLLHSAGVTPVRMAEKPRPRPPADRSRPLALASPDAFRWP